ncbi:MAG: MoxR family ATPase [Cutibacterium avidum]|nr:MoxR family ATPase [Cutibacterium avidum]TLP95813.1 MoxR family ATPase [Cutibacterium avidum]
MDPTEVDRARRLVKTISRAFDSKVVGQEALRTALLVGLIGGGHVLLESVPGLAKTLAASTLASTVDASFSRVQCTPDLLPSDIIGTQVFNPGSSTFTTELGPVHANVVLLDEINRSSAKTQAAMLEAMQERQATIGGKTYPMPDPFLVLATQNPIDEEGTYVLPQAQMDRFLLKVIVDYPSPADEVEMLRRLKSGALESRTVSAVVSRNDVLWLQGLSRRVHVDESLLHYIVQIVHATRHAGDYLPQEQARYLEYGASPRATIAFVEAACAHALMHGRDHVIPDDVRAMRHMILRHRLILTFEAVATQVPVEEIIDGIFGAVPTP